MEGTIIFNLESGYMEGTLFDSSGKQLGTMNRELKLHMDEDCLEQDPEEWYLAITEITRQMQERFDDVLIDTISVTYHPGIFVYIDRLGSHIMNAIIKCSCRTKYQEEMYEKNFKYQDERCRIPWKYMLHPKIVWINYNRPDVFKRIYKILTPDGYLAYRLCGETGIDPVSALFMGCNFRNSDYYLRFPDNMKLDRKLFPDIKKTGECIGVVSGNEKEKLGLKTDAKFIMSSNNLVCLSNLCRDNLKLVYDVESSTICFKGDFFKVKKGSELIRLPGNAEGEYVYAISGDDRAMFVKAVRNFMNTENKDGKCICPGSNGIMVYPYLTGRMNCNGPDTMGSIMGLSFMSSMDDIACACYECIGYDIRENIMEVLGHGRKFDSMAVIGGERNEIFYQMLSDILSKAVYNVDKQSTMSTAVYNIISDKNITVEVESTYSPDIERGRKYSELFSLYRFALSSINDIYRYRKRILKKIVK